MLFSTKQFKTIFLSAFVLFAVLAITQPTTTYAADASTVGVVNYQQLINQHPDMAQANETYKAAVKQAQDDFNTKSANMNDQDKKALSQQLQQGLQQKQQELINAIRDKVNAAIKAVAEDKGLTVVMDKSVIAYGGQDITDDVLKKITGK
ncbi:outer membrane protein [Sporomusaceae bacterium BoRhaA]|uniref:OmpH family outer membrane protein n=1 Tax=Pelorhabdus rhamnosifermentans TaxID=2772457 RepID=UPI001C061D51|nr:OmpH family outer membrane protein [Pelorhabdus rhamnosifermentans]MBU2703793.1 outer membrane protein [Pelorhabdus rhamnosifermentans]